MFTINDTSILVLAEKGISTDESVLDNRNRRIGIEITERLRSIAELTEEEVFIDANGWHAVDILEKKIKIIKKNNAVLTPTIAKAYTRPAIGASAKLGYTLTSPVTAILTIEGPNSGGNKYLSAGLGMHFFGVVLVVMVGGGGGGTSGAVGKGGGGGGGGEAVGFLIDINAMEVGDQIRFTVGAGGEGGKGTYGSSDLNLGSDGGDTSMSYKKADESNWTVKFTALGGQRGSGGSGGKGGGSSEATEPITWKKLPDQDDKDTSFQLLYRHSGKNGRDAETKGGDSVSDASGYTYYNDATVTLQGLKSGMCSDTGTGKHTGGGGGACGNLIRIHGNSDNSLDCGGTGAVEYTDGGDGILCGGGGGGGGGYNLLFSNLDPRNGGNGKNGCIYIYE